MYVPYMYHTCTIHVPCMCHVTTYLTWILLLLARSSSYASTSSTTSYLPFPVSTYLSTIVPALSDASFCLFHGAPSFVSNDICLIRFAVHASVPWGLKEFSRGNSVFSFPPPRNTDLDTRLPGPIHEFENYIILTNFMDLAESFISLPYRIGFSHVLSFTVLVKPRSRN